MAHIPFLMTDDSVPQTAPVDDPEVTIYRLDTDAAVVSGAAMTHVGQGLWRYDFTPSTTLEYGYVIDADPNAAGQVTAGERYFYGGLSGTDVEHLDQLDTTVSSRATQASVDVIDGIVDAILVDTGTTIPALIAALNDIDIADVQTAMTNQGYTGARAVLLDFLDAAISSRNSVIPLAAATDQAEHDATQAAIAGIPAAPSAADNADAVWDEARAGHSTPGTFGEFTGAEAMRGTDGANTVVPMAAATSQAEHDATQAAIAAITSLTPADVTSAVWGITEAALAAEGETGELLLFGNTLRSDIDFTGSDALGWQLVVYDRNDTEIARANLFDEAFSRIPAATSVSAFIASNKAIARVDVI